MRHDAVIAFLVSAPLFWGSFVKADPESGPTPAETTQPAAIDYSARAAEVTRYIQTEFYLPSQGVYAHSLSDRHAEFMWGNGILFPALLGAARHDPQTNRPRFAKFFTSMDRYWDKAAPIPGYEPAPTRGHGNDKYYDDNAWMVLTFLEAYEQTGEQRYLDRADETLRFVLSGWDDTYGGGIWWHEQHKGHAKNTCVNAPAAVACLRIAKFQSPEKAKASVEMATKIVEWTVKTFETKDGLFADSVNVETGHMNRAQLTYNTALMIRAFNGLHQATGDPAWLDKANRAAKASDWFLSAKTGAYRDNVKWSHLLVEADLEMYRGTHEEYLLQRAKNNADYVYAQWKQHPPEELIENASIARMLWLLADTQSEEGRQFWLRVDDLAAKTPKN